MIERLRRNFHKRPTEEKVCIAISLAVLSPFLVLLLVMDVLIDWVTEP